MGKFTGERPGCPIANWAPFHSPVGKFPGVVDFCSLNLVKRQTNTN